MYIQFLFLKSYSTNINENEINKPDGGLNKFYFTKEIVKIKLKHK